MIRNAIIDDVDLIVKLGHMMLKESKLANAGYDTNKCAKRAREFIEMDNGIALIAEKNGVAVGCLIAGVAQRFFSEKLFAFEQVVYITPEARGEGLGVDLIKEYIHQAKQLNAEVINLGINSGVNEVKTGQLYESLGFALTGHTYTMSVD